MLQLFFRLFYFGNSVKIPRVEMSEEKNRPQLNADDGSSSEDAENNNGELVEGAVGGIQEEFLVGTSGGDQEASTSDPKPEVILGIEDIQQAYLANAKKKLMAFQDIKDDLIETIRGMKETARRNPGNWEIFERLREHINEAYAFLDEIKEAMSVQEIREEYMNLQINEFFERRREQGENFKGNTVRVGTIAGVDVTIKTEYRSDDEQMINDASAEGSVDKSEIAQAFVEQVLESARARQNVGENAEEAGVEVPAARIEEIPRPMQEAANVNVAEDSDDDGRLPYPIVTGKYTLAIRAHQLYPESSSSEDSHPEDEQYHQRAERNAHGQLLRRGNDAGEDERAEDHQGTSSDSPIEDQSSHQL